MSPSTTSSSNAKTPLAYNPLTKPRNVKLDEGILAFARRGRGNNANGSNHSHSTNPQALPCPVLPPPDDSASTELGESLAAAEGLYDEDTCSETEAIDRLNSGVDRLKSGVLKLSQRIDMLEKVALKDKQIAEMEKIIDQNRQDINFKNYIIAYNGERLASMRSTILSLQAHIDCLDTLSRTTRS